MRAVGYIRVSSDEQASEGVSLDAQRAKVQGYGVLNVLMSGAQWEREAIGERTRDALQHKIRQGERCGKVRFGHDLAGDGVRLVANPAEQEGLALLKELAARGMPLRAIARELTARGIPTKEGRPAWDHSSVRRILQRTG